MNLSENHWQGWEKTSRLAQDRASLLLLESVGFCRRSGGVDELEIKCTGSLPGSSCLRRGLNILCSVRHSILVSAYE